MLQQNGPCNDYLLIQNPNHAKYRYIRCENITNRQLLYQDSSAFDLENINIRFHADMFNASTIQEAKPQKFALEYVGMSLILYHLLGLLTGFKYNAVAHETKSFKTAYFGSCCATL